MYVALGFDDPSHANSYRYGLRRAAVRLAGSCSPYLATVHRPRQLTTSTASLLLRPSRITPNFHLRRAYASEPEKEPEHEGGQAVPAAEKLSQDEVAEATSDQEQAALPSQETPEGLQETTAAEDAVDHSAAEPLQPETTSAEPLNIGEVDEGQPAEPAAAEPAAAGSAATPADAASDEAAGAVAGAPPAADAAAPAEPLPTPGQCLYLGNLYFEVTDKDIRQHFEPYGKIAAVSIVRDLRGVSRGYGFIEFEDKEVQAKARTAEDGQPFRGRRLAVRDSKSPEERASDAETRGGAGGRPWQARGPRPPSEPSKTLFVGNLSYDMSDADLNDLFRDMRGVVDVRVAIDRQSGQPRGFAHADFVDVEAATTAKALLETKTPHGRRVKADFSFSRGRGKGPPVRG